MSTMHTAPFTGEPSSPSDDLRDVLLAGIPSTLSWARRPVSRLLGVDAALAAIDPLHDLGSVEFVGRTLTALGIAYTITGPTLPTDGPLVVVANHPHGAIDGLILLDHLLGLRSDVRLLANEVLTRIPALGDLIIPVANARSGRSNHAALLAARDHLRADGCLLIFPAGEVAGLSTKLHVHEGQWHRGVGSLLKRTRATAVACSISGANSVVFYAVRALNRRLAAALLIRETLRLRGRRVVVHVGPTIDANALADRSTEEITATLRAQRDRLEHIRPR